MKSTWCARTTVAFNAMQAQIKDHLAERVQILAAISHDLQTPITRMRLRAELMESGNLQEKLQSDLDALLDSLVCDYVDAQQLARALQGTISLRNREGGGLDARLIFPVPRPSPAGGRRAGDEGD